MICGLTLAIIIILIKEKRIKELFKCALFFILGIIIVTAPIIIYFYKVDALYDMLYGTFIHNFLYINSNIPTTMYLTSRILIAFILTALLIFNCKKNSQTKYYNLIVTLCYLTTLFTVNIGIKNDHYYVLAIPLISIFMPPIIDIFTSKSMNIWFKIFVLSYICIIFILGCFIPQVYFKINYENTGLENISSFINGNIPENDRDKVLAIRIYTAQIYLYADIFPCYKYAFMQDYLFVSNPEIMQEMYNFIKQGNVKYIIYENLDEIENKDEIQELVFENYTKKDSMILYEPNQLKIETRELVLYELDV